MLQTIPPTPPPAPVPSARRGPRGRRRVALRIVLALIWLTVVVIGTRAGLDLRDWVWQETAPIRFRGDVANAMRIGHGVNTDAVARARARDPASVPKVAGRFPVAGWGDTWAAYRAQYDLAYGGVMRLRPPGAGPPTDASYSFDYPPGRLWIVTAWLREVRADSAIDSSENLFRRSYDDAAIGPMLRVNAWHEWFAAAGLFAVARRVLRRAGRSPRRATSLATLAALLGWFNPAVLLNAHGWPQWDAWVLPYAVWAVYFGLADGWLMAGALLAVGAMFKGQVLLIAPLLVMWPLFRLDVDAVARLAAGFVFAAAACLSPWLLQTTPATAWLAGVIVFAVLLAAGVRWQRPSALRTRVRNAFGLRPNTDRNVCATEASAPTRRPFLRDSRAIAFVVLALAAVAWIVAPFAVPGAPVGFGTMLLLAGFAVGLPGVWRGRGIAIALATVGLATFAAGARFDGSFAWLPVGFQTDRYSTMSMGRVVNLPAILAGAYGWQVDSPVSLFGWTTVQMRTLLRGLSSLGIALVAAALARGTARGRRGRLDANLLVALPAAWAVLYAVLPQMHERYLLWAAFTSALLAARSIGGLLAHLFLTAAQVAMLLLAMIGAKRVSSDPAWRDWYRTFEGMQPSLGYAVTLMACVLVVWAMTRERMTNVDVRTSHR